MMLGFFIGVAVCVFGVFACLCFRLLTFLLKNSTIQNLQKKFSQGYKSGLCFEVIRYESSLDGTGPLLANVVYLKGKTNLPVLVFMHGYAGNRSRMLDAQARCAEKGFLVVAPDLRGRGVVSERTPYSRYTPKHSYPQARFESDLALALKSLKPPSLLLAFLGDGVCRRLVEWRARKLFKVLAKKRDLKDFAETYENSAGHADDGAKEVFDVVDALDCVHKQFGNICDVKQNHVIGFSGGGGTVFSLVTKFPDLFQTAASFYGMADYAHWYAYANCSNRDEFQKMMQENIGGSPSEVPLRYQARNSLLGVQNNPLTKIHLYWDQEEFQCPGFYNLVYGDKARSFGYTNVHLHETFSGTQGRLIHGHPFCGKNWVCIDEYLQVALSQSNHDLFLPQQMEFQVLGYLRTQKFFLVLGSGDEAIVKLKCCFEDQRCSWSFSGYQGPKNLVADLVVFIDPQSIKSVQKDGQVFSDYESSPQGFVFQGIEPQGTYCILY